MPYPDLLQKLTNYQHQVWQSVSQSFSDSAGFDATFGDPHCDVIPASDLYPEMATPKLVIQFAFADHPENLMVIFADAELVGEIYGTHSGQMTSSIDEARVNEMRPIWESVIQGICIGAGQIKGEPIVATAMQIRYQVLSFPPNLQRVEEVVRSRANLSWGSTKGTFSWVMDVATAKLFANDTDEEQVRTPIGAASADHHGASAPALQPEATAFELLFDVPLDITVELGRVRMLVRDVIELGAGSIIEIDKAAGEPVDVMVNGRLVARGEVVVIEDNFGVRITEILTPAERLASLGEAA